MCILCVVQRWSRRVATMLPWLVIPLIILWALSQLLPPNLRFEITSPRLACVLVLLITLFWYEILMPQLSIWRARRSARLREQRRTKAIELQKMKKSATRRCRNCLTPYRDQNPGGGKFMCSYCGHISKRPVLDFPSWPEWSGEHRYYGGDDRCLTEKSYSGVLVFGCRVIGSFFLSIRWTWRKVFRFGSRDDGSLDGESKGLLGKQGENGDNFQESRGERARRKAEEKRQARLEREMLEEEERKQREEVARLVEERRRLRDDMLEAERSRSKGPSSVDGERENRKDAERRRRERRREKDKGSSKSTSDGEEHEKRVCRESEKKREFDRKGEIERQKALVENFRAQVLDGGNGNKVAMSKSRYFDRMRGPFFGPSRGFTSASIFGRNAQATVTVNKVSKSVIGVVDYAQNSGNKKDAHTTGRVLGKPTTNGDHRIVGTDVQPRTTAPKKSWHQLFTRSSSVSPDPDTNDFKFPTQNGHLEARNIADQKASSSYSVDNQFNFSQSLSPSSYSKPNGSSNGNLGPNVAANSIFPPFKDSTLNLAPEDAELFEDPCYVPDPVALLGPVSDSLGRFPLDLGGGFIDNNKVEASRILKNTTASIEVTKPAPIESPLSRSRISEEKQVSCTPTSQKLNASNSDELSDAHGPGTWQMWDTPLPRDGLGLVGGPSSWFSPLMQGKSNHEEVKHLLGHNPVISEIATRSPPPSILTPKKANIGNLQNGGTFSPLGPGLGGNDPWLQNSPFSSPLPVDGERHFLPLDLIDNIAQSEVTFSTPPSSAAGHPFEVPPAEGWSKEEWAILHGAKEVGKATTSVRSPHIGGSLFSSGPDVQSVWSFNHQ